MKHERRHFGFPGCVCGYRRYDADKQHAELMVEAHIESRHDISEHVAIINQLVTQTASQPNANQDVALAILHLTECVTQLVNRPEVS